MPPFSVPSYFDESGKPTKMFEKPQHWWNKRSLAIKYDPDWDTVEREYLYFDGNLKRANSNVVDAIRTNIFRAIPNSHLSNAYVASNTYGSLRKEVMNYVYNPSVITPKSLTDTFRRIKDE
jgi:hypothetical protein